MKRDQFAWFWCFSLECFVIAEENFAARWAAVMVLLYRWEVAAHWAALKLIPRLETNHWTFHWNQTSVNWTLNNLRYHWQLAGLLSEPPSNLRFLSLKIQLWKSIKWSGFAMIVLWCSGYAITNLILTDLESFSLCIAQYDSKDQQKNIHKRWKMLHTVIHY